MKYLSQDHLKLAYQLLIILAKKLPLRYVTGFWMHLWKHFIGKDLIDQVES